jgi:hypothetical protein
MVSSLFFQSFSPSLNICILFEKMLFSLLFLFGIMVQTTVVVDVYRLSADLELECHLSVCTNTPSTHTHTHTHNCIMWLQ